MHFKWCYKICICSVTPGELGSFRNFKGLLIRETVERSKRLSVLLKKILFIPLLQSLLKFPQTKVER